MIAFSDAHLFGWKPSGYLAKATLWIAYTVLWIPLRLALVAGWKRSTEQRRGFIARHIFDGTTRHCYLFGGTDWGKSSLIKEAVADLVPDCLAGKKSMFVMDGTELIDEILAKLRLSEKQIRERVILIDLANPGGRNDVGSLPRLNLMETKGDDGEHDEFVDLTARTMVFDMVFSGLLDSQTTGPMRTMLSFAAQTMAYVDNPSVDHFLELLRNPLAFIEDLDGLDPMITSYWQDEIKLRPVKEQGQVVGHEPIENETARALGRRAHQMVSNPIVKRLMVNSVPTVNLAKRLREGAIVLVATRKGKVMPAGARLVGRFMLSMLLRAVDARNSLAEPMQTACFIDEFPNFLQGRTDEALLSLLAEARKKGVSITLAHQEEGQLSPEMLSALLVNCNVIVAGGMSANQAAKVRYPLGIKIIEGVGGKKEPSIDIMDLKPKHFAASVRGRKPIVIQSIRDPLGDRFHRLPAGKKGQRLIAAELDRARAIMRELYADDPSVVATVQHELDAIFKEPVPI